MGDASAQAHAGGKLRLRHRDRVIELDENSEPFMMGREASNQLVVEADWVSRTHAQIEFKRGHFVIADRSTNATYVCIGQDNELRLHRDELHLRKSGTISMGQAVALNLLDTIFFETE
jgi:predicted component of type VI protein secretion system